MGHVNIDEMKQGFIYSCLCVLWLGGCVPEYKSNRWYDTQANITPRKVVVKLNPAAPLKKGEVRARAGDTYYSLALKHKVDLRELLDLNGATPPYALAIGKIVKVPDEKRHIVKPGETLYSIAQAYGVSMRNIATTNTLPMPFIITENQELIIPGGVLKSTAPKNVNTARVQKKKPKVVRPTAIPQRKGKFIRPVSGKIISRFGVKADGLHNDGINIAAASGTPIRATENGVVVYIGNELRGYGNLMLIRHDKKWISAYAHISKFWFGLGDEVKQGDIIGEVGTSGAVERPQLHFELRQGTKAIDPEKFL